jgi:Arc/MetJ-type ribon-helix-helix transcriptional regulator
MKLRNTGVNVGSKIPVAVKQCIIKVVQEGDYLSVSDFVRDAVKEKLVHDGYQWKLKSGKGE